MSWKYKVYPEYKNSGVEWLGDIPASWKIARIKNFSILNPSKQKVKDLADETEVTFLPMEAIGDDGKIDVTKSKKISDVINGYTYIGENDVCIAKITPCFENGKGAVTTGLKNRIAFATTEVIPLRCNEKSDSKFLYYLLTAPPFNKKAEGSMYGAGGQKRVSDSFVANYHFALPQINERSQITNFLDHETAKIDTLIEKQKQLIKLLKEKRQAVISHAVTKGLNPDAPMRDSGVEWLGEVPEHWDLCTLQRYVSFIDGDRGSEYPNDKDLMDDGILFLSSKNIVDGTLDLTEAKFISQLKFDVLNRGKALNGDLIVKVRGSTGRIGELAKFDVTDHGYETAFINAQMMIIRVNNKLLPDYLRYVSQSISWTEQLFVGAYGTAQQQLSNEVFSGLKIIVPPMKEQIKIIEKLNERVYYLKKLMKKAEVGISLIQERRIALISAAVTGKIDLRDWTPP